MAKSLEEIEIYRIIAASKHMIPFLSNCFHFGNSCLFFEFFALIDVLQMKPNVICRTIKQHPHSLLSAPYGIILIVHLTPLFLTFNLGNQELSCTASNFELLWHKRLNLFIGSNTPTCDKSTKKRSIQQENIGEI